MERMLRANLRGSLIVGLEEDRWVALSLVRPRFAAIAQELCARALRILHVDVRDLCGDRYEDFKQRRQEEVRELIFPDEFNSLQLVCLELVLLLFAGVGDGSLLCLHCFPNASERVAPTESVLAAFGSDTEGASRVQI